MACRFAGSEDLQGFWQTVERGRVEIEDVPPDRWDVNRFCDPDPRARDRSYSRRLAHLRDVRSFAPRFFGITPRRARVMDPQQRLMLDCARLAIEDAGYARGGLPAPATGVYIGVSVSEHKDIVTGRVHLSQLMDRAGDRGLSDSGTAVALLDGLPRFQAHTMVGQMLNMNAANVSQAFDFGGPALAVDTACSSALVALHEAVLHLRIGLTDAAVAGAVYVNLDPGNFIAFSRIGALSRHGRCVPFDRRADGFVIGEGVGAVVLKRLDDAVRDGDRVWAVIRGIAVNNDGRGAGPMTPSRDGQARVIEQAWRDAGVPPASAALIEAHGTATEAGDLAEVLALKTVFGPPARRCALTSVKANIGHTLAASGMASVIKASLALWHRRIPPHASFEEPRPDLGLEASPFFVPREAQPWRTAAPEPRRAGVSSFGFGGTNVHVVLEEAPPSARHAAAGDTATVCPAGSWPFVFYAPDATLLRGYLDGVRTALDRSAEPLADVAWTACMTRRPDAARAAFMASTREELLAALDRARAGAIDEPEDWPADLAACFEHRRGRCVALPPSPLRTQEFWLLSRPIASAGEEAAPAADGLEDAVLATLERVSAYGRDHLTPERRLTADLGFDSLMTADLTAGLATAIAGLAEGFALPDGPDLSIAELVGYVRRSILQHPAPDAVAATPPEARPVRRFVAGWVDRLPPKGLAGAILPLEPPVAIRPDRGGLAGALAARLEAEGLAVYLTTGELRRETRAVIDLSAVDGAGEIRDAPLRLLACLRRVPLDRPLAAVVAVHRGLAGAGLPGFLKALAGEWPSSLVKSIRLDAVTDPELAARQIVQELTGGDRAPEIAMVGARILAPALLPAPVAPAAIRDRAVVVIAGGTGGIGARVARALAAAHHARLILLGRHAAADDLLADIRRAGGDAVCLTCDVRDHPAVAAAVARGVAAFGHVDHVLHAAGVIEDAPLARKDPDSFARVFDTKVTGASSLAAATADEPLRSFVMLSSWAGRFGNAGQTDYAAASHALAELAVDLGARRPSVHVCALELPLWLGTTMAERVPAAARGAMAARGASFLSDDTGIAAVLAELGQVGPGGAVLLASSPVVPAREIVQVVHLTLDACPWLAAHRIDGVMVVPIAHAVDLCLAAAKRLLPASDGPLRLADLERRQGIRLGDDGVYVWVRARVDGASVAVDLSSAGSLSGTRVPGYAASVFPGAVEAALIAEPDGTASGPISASDFYARHTFHGPQLHVMADTPRVGERHVSGTVRCSGSPGEDVDVPALDGVLQTAAYWAVVRHGRIPLPTAIRDMRVLRPIGDPERIRCVGALEAHVDGATISGQFDIFDSAGTLIAQLRGLEARFRAGETPVPVDESSYRIERFPEVVALRQRMADAAAAGLCIPYFTMHEAVARDTSRVEGREVISFSTYNYLGLSGSPEVTAAAADAVTRYGTSVSASRVAAGERPIHRQLEAGIARFLGCEDAVVFVSGHATNVTTIGHLVGRGDLILCDALSHDSIFGGARLSGARYRTFPHNDCDALEEMLRAMRAQARRVLIAVEGTYSMDGDVPPLDRFIALKRKHRALLLVDEAHSLGVLGDTGRGVGEQFGVDRCDVELWMGTLSKTLASCGGYIAGSAALVEYLKFTAPGFVYSVGISPPNAAAALAALEQLAARPDLPQTLRQRSDLFRRLCRERGVNTGASAYAAVVPCIIGDSHESLRMAAALGRRGVNVHPIVYPAVEEPLARLRFFISALHSEDQLRYTVEALHAELAAARGVGPR